MISADLPPPLPVETAVIAYYESAPANRPVTILFGKDATYSLKLVPNRFEKSRLVCVITTKNKPRAVTRSRQPSNPTSCSMLAPT
jgi:hypothetical protein